MSACISRHGEYSSHVHEATGDHRFACARCWVLDEDAILAALDTAEALETRIEYGHQTLELGWIPEYRGIKYASHQRTVHFRVDEPLLLDHWSDPDGVRKPFDPQPVAPSGPQETAE